MKKIVALLVFIGAFFFVTNAYAIDNNAFTGVLTTYGTSIPPIGNVDDLPEVNPGDLDNPPSGWYNMKGFGISYLSGDNMGWYDANKWYRFDPREDGAIDKNACWKASSANQLHWWLTQNKKYIKKYLEVYPLANEQEKKMLLFDSIDPTHYDPILSFYLDHFFDKSGYQTGGNQWFITGEKTDQLAAPFRGDYYEHFNGFFSHVFNHEDGTDGLTDYIKFAGGKSDVLRYFSNFVENALKNKRSVGFELYFPESHYRHAVTLWGAEFKNGLIQYIYYSDSDEQNDYAEKMARIQRIKVLTSDDGRTLFEVSDRNITKPDFRYPQIISASSLDLGTNIWKKWMANYTTDTDIKESDKSLTTYVGVQPDESSFKSLFGVDNVEIIQAPRVNAVGDSFALVGVNGETYRVKVVVKEPLLTDPIWATGDPLFRGPDLQIDKDKYKVGEPIFRTPDLSIDEYKIGDALFRNPDIQIDEHAKGDPLFRGPDLNLDRDKYKLGEPLFINDIANTEETEPVQIKPKENTNDDSKVDSIKSEFVGSKQSQSSLVVSPAPSRKHAEVKVTATTAKTGDVGALSLSFAVLSATLGITLLTIKKLLKQ